MMNVDTANMCSHLHMQDDAELTAVVRSRQLHIYRNGKKVLVLAGKSAPKIIKSDRICEMLPEVIT